MFAVTSRLLPQFGGGTLTQTHTQNELVNISSNTLVLTIILYSLNRCGCGLRAGIPRPTGNFPESLSQAILVGITLRDLCTEALQPAPAQLPAPRPANEPCAAGWLRLGWLKMC